MASGSRVVSSARTGLGFAVAPDVETAPRDLSQLPPAQRSSSVGSRLRNLRRERGLSQSQLARVAGMTQGAISHYETGRREMSVHALVDLCAALTVRVEDLVEGSLALPQADQLPVANSPKHARRVAGKRGGTDVSALLGSARAVDAENAFFAVQEAALLGGDIISAAVAAVAAALEQCDGEPGSSERDVVGAIAGAVAAAGQSSRAEAARVLPVLLGLYADVLGPHRG
jgi:transcriptional regulator with XRE-family HTH domain